MKTDARKKIFNLAKAYGFELVRQKKHYVFVHKSGARLVTSRSCSDFRALKNVETTIKKLLLNNDSNHSR
jgi:predicted RNA binding protein YcfA (HicA-like mRNA interferase family)